MISVNKASAAYRPAALRADHLQRPRRSVEYGSARHHEASHAHALVVLLYEHGEAEISLPQALDLMESCNERILDKHGLCKLPIRTALRFHFPVPSPRLPYPEGNMNRNGTESTCYLKVDENGKRTTLGSSVDYLRLWAAASIATEQAVAS